MGEGWCLICTYESRVDMNHLHVVVGTGITSGCTMPCCML